MLIACLFWSFLGAAINDDIYYGAVGWDFFMGYFSILAFPLIVIVPFGAFRSLTGEREDGTYELLSITTLRPSQIVNGKLVSAVMQMMVYLSAVAPCLAFTYLLRGIDLFSIGLILFWLVVGSLLLSVVALMLATLTSVRHWQMLMTVFVILGLAWCFFMTLPIVGGALYREPLGIVMESWEFWAGSFAALSGVFMLAALAYSVAHAQLKFPTDNRSTSVRIVMVMCAVVFVAWMSWGTWTFAEDMDSVTIPIAIAAMFYFPFWTLMGAFLVGEYGELSRRIKRTLPRTFVGRMVSTWFIPGSGTGYVFAVLCAVTGSLFGMTAAVIADWYLPASGGGFFSFPVSRLMLVLIYSPLYLTAYLGLGRLIVLGLRKFMQVGVVASLLLNLIVFAIGSLIPFVIEMVLFQGFRNAPSMYLQMTSPIYVVAAVADGIVSGSQLLPHVAIVAVVALVIFLCNLPSVIREIRQQRVAAPVRVQEEEQAAAPEPVQVASNPFDD